MLVDIGNDGYEILWENSDIVRFIEKKISPEFAEMVKELIDYKPIDEYNTAMAEMTELLIDIGVKLEKRVGKTVPKDMIVTWMYQIERKFEEVKEKSKVM